MKYISTLIALILFSFFSTAQNSKIVPKVFYKTILNSLDAKYVNVDVTMGYAKGTGSIIIGYNNFSFSINVLRGKDQQFGTITNITTESNNLNDFLIRFEWKNNRTDQGTISGEIQLFYSLSKNRYDTYFINNSNSVFKIYWETELDRIQKDSLNSIINKLYKKEFLNESEESKLKRSEEIELEKDKEIKYQKYANEKRAFEIDRIREGMGLPPLNEKKREEDRQKRIQNSVDEKKLEEDRQKMLQNNEIALANAKQFHSSIIGIPVKIENFEVAQNDFPNKMNWDDAKKQCENLGSGWRLPTKDELNNMFNNKEKISGFSISFYWSSSEKLDLYGKSVAWGQNFFGNGDANDGGKNYPQSVRAVRTRTLIDINHNESKNPIEITFIHESVNTSKIILSYINNISSIPSTMNLDGVISNLFIYSNNTYNVSGGPFDRGKLIIYPNNKSIQLFDNKSRSVAYYYQK